MAFFRVLRAAVPTGFTLQSKVRLADVLACPEWAWERSHGRRISQKHLDFVLCRSSDMRIVLAIELDDRSHDLPQRRQRDQFLNAALAGAGVPLLRVRAASRYDIAALRAAIAAEVPTPWLSGAL